MSRSERVIENIGATLSLTDPPLQARRGGCLHLLVELKNGNIGKSVHT